MLHIAVPTALGGLGPQPQGTTGPLRILPASRAKGREAEFLSDFEAPTRRLDDQALGTSTTWGRAPPPKN